MAAPTKISTFTLTDVAVAPRPTAPASTPTWVDLPGAESSAYKGEVQEVEQYGDDRLLNTWYHSPKGSLTIKMTQQDADAIAALGYVVDKDAATSKTTIWGGTAKELIPDRLMFRAKMPYRNEVTGAVSNAMVYFFNCTAQPVDGLGSAERAKVGEITIMAKVMPSEIDEKGDAVPAEAEGYAMYRCDWE